MVLPPLHATANAESWLRAWHLDPILAPLLTAAGVGYLIAYQTVQRSGRRPPPIWRATAYFAGLAALAVALLGPPDHFNGVLFWVHMVQHLLLMLVAAPLLVLGRPVSLFLLALPPGPRRRVLRAALGFHPARRAISLALHPLSVFLLYNGSFVLWHLPSLYQAAVAEPARPRAGACVLLRHRAALLAGPARSASLAAPALYRGSSAAALRHLDGLGSALRDSDALRRAALPDLRDPAEAVGTELSG
jgi:hypothetical protein